jgi:hypothetical protein
MFRKFKFEEEHYETLGVIPYSTRQKFDLVGLKLDAASWKKLPLQERQVLCHLSVRSHGERDAFRDFLVMALERAGVTPVFEEPSANVLSRAGWENPGRMSTRVVEASFRAGVPLRPEDWLRFDDMERYVLYRVAHEEPERMAQVIAEILKGARRGKSVEEGFPRGAHI